MAKVKGAITIDIEKCKELIFYFEKAFLIARSDFDEFRNIVRDQVKYEIDHRKSHNDG